MFFSDEIVDALFLSAFHSLSNHRPRGWWTRPEANRVWNEFLASAYITIVQGESANPADSGFLFARKARQILGMPEEQLLFPDQALKAAADGFVGPMIFVDDFIGSGEQFIKTWTRRRSIPGHGRISFEDLPRNSRHPFVYCSAVLTEYGRSRILRACPTVKLVTGNVIPDTYSWTSAFSILWPDHERDAGIEFIRRVSAKIGLGDDAGGERDWRGFHMLGLGVAFEHSTPDATLPIFHWTETWRPLVRRS